MHTATHCLGAIMCSSESSLVTHSIFIAFFCQLIQYTVYNPMSTKRLTENKVASKIEYKGKAILFI